MISHIAFAVIFFICMILSITITPIEYYYHIRVSWFFLISYIISSEYLRKRSDKYRSIILQIEPYPALFLWAENNIILNPMTNPEMTIHTYITVKNYFKKHKSSGPKFLGYDESTETRNKNSVSVRSFGVHPNNIHVLYGKYNEHLICIKFDKESTSLFDYICITPTKLLYGYQLKYEWFREVDPSVILETTFGCMITPNGNHAIYDRLLKTKDITVSDIVKFKNLDDFTNAVNEIVSLPFQNIGTGILTKSAKFRR